MSWIETNLTRLEHQLRKIIEGDPPAEGIPHQLHHQLEEKLTTAMRAAIQTVPTRGIDGHAELAPDEYTLVLPPQQAELLLTHPLELDRLAHHLEMTSLRGRYRFARSPLLRVVADPESDSSRVIAGYSQACEANTRTAVVDAASADGNGVPIRGQQTGFLIVNGLTTIPLTRTVINLGRDAGNHIQVSDPRVSRFHAQIRLIHGRFVIFDLDSRGGTTVNDLQVTSHILNPGDVILLAGVPLVYGQEQGVQDGFTQEVPADPL